MSERTTVRLPEKLIERAKKRAANDGRTLTALIEDGLRRVLSDTLPLDDQRRLPRVSAATGGLQPGIELNHSAALQELDDLDHSLQRR